jgi:HEPN domain-containing protein
MTNDKDKIDPSTLIEISLNDFEVADILFDIKDSRYYPQAIYMLQQSLEKAIKAALVCLGWVENEKELKNKIGHKVAERTLELLKDKAKESIIDVINSIIQRVNYENEEKVKNIVWDMLKITINNLIVDKTVEDFINKIKNLIDNDFQQINNKMDDKEVTKIFQDVVKTATNQSRELAKQIQDFVTTATNQSRELAKQIKEYLTKFSIIGLSINITQSFDQLLELKLKLSLYTALLIILHAPLDNSQAKLRYHLPKIDEDINLLYLGVLIKGMINEIQINNKNILENLKEIIDYFKNNQIPN